MTDSVQHLLFLQPGDLLIGVAKQVTYHPVRILSQQRRWCPNSIGRLSQASGDTSVHTASHLFSYIEPKILDNMGSRE